MRILDAGKFNQVPMIIGDVSDEGRMFVYEIINSTSSVECDAIITAMFDLHALEVW